MEPMRRTTRGLPAIARARSDRLSGRARWTTQAGLLAAAAVIAGLIAHRVVSDRDLYAGRQGLLAKQRAVAATLGVEWYPMRDRLESEVLEAAKGFAGDLVDPVARQGEFRSQPGLYLRMRVADAGDVASIRRTAAEAKKDAFAACLLREPNERGIRGEIDGGAFAEQPWNLGQAYAATRVLTEEWVGEVRAADDDLRLRVFTEQYEKAVREEVPLAVDVVRRARFFLLVLDEDVPEAAVPAEGGAITEGALQLVPHPARIHVFDLTSGREILRLLRSGDARVIPASEHFVVDSETREAMQRQANNCALAGRVQEMLAPPPHPG